MRAPSNQSSYVLQPRPSQSPLQSVNTLRTTQSLDIRQFPKMQYGEDLQLALSNSEQLLKKVYRLRTGIKATRVRGLGDRPSDPRTFAP